MCVRQRLRTILGSLANSFSDAAAAALNHVTSEKENQYNGMSISLQRKVSPLPSTSGPKKIGA